MSSLRSHEGVLLIDNRNSPGVPDEIMVNEGKPIGSGQGLFESATFTCSHCNAIVVMNPKRNRSRGYCRKCDHYVCDNCEARRVASGYECLTMKEIADKILNAAAKKAPSSEIFQSPMCDPTPVTPTIITNL